MWAGLLLACASLVGIEELDELPARFPLEIAAPTGHVTRAPSGQVAVDAVYEDAAAARAGWARLVEAAEGDGFSRVEEGRVDKRDRVVLEGPRGRLQLDCCPQRADRRHLVLVSWWP